MKALRQKPHIVPDLLVSLRKQLPSSEWSCKCSTQICLPWVRTREPLPSLVSVTRCVQPAAQGHMWLVGAVSTAQHKITLNKTRECLGFPAPPPPQEVHSGLLLPPPRPQSASPSTLVARAGLICRSVCAHIYGLT